jgi:hypothetical protein
VVAERGVQPPEQLAERLGEVGVRRLRRGERRLEPALLGLLLLQLGVDLGLLELPVLRELDAQLGYRAVEALYLGRQLRALLRRARRRRRVRRGAL